MSENFQININIADNRSQDKKSRLGKKKSFYFHMLYYFIFSEAMNPFACDTNLPQLSISHCICPCSSLDL